MLAFALAIVLGITSLPSVTSSLTWKEFSFVQSKLGWTALLLACTHDFMYGLQGFALMFRGEYDFMADPMKIVKVRELCWPWTMECVLRGHVQMTSA